ncbi:MAG TPA: histidine phosphatase family protein [Thermoanaerobaculia bacterium]|nr:histidine phosphatase family protein [Thermoanaerobaculia bacterium]
MIDQILLVRHGETLDNIRGVAQGWSDSVLSDRGLQQVQRLAERIGACGPTALYSSNLPRAVSSALEVARATGLEPRVLDDLRELNCGEWEGSTFVDVQRAEPDFFRRWTKDMSLACPGGESFVHLAERMKRALDRIQGDDGDGRGTVVIVSHGLAIRVAATLLLGLPLETSRSFAQDNAALNIFQWRMDRYVLKVWNDTSHCP